MNETRYIYLVKTIEDNKIQFTPSVEEADGVMMSQGRICAVLKRYAAPVDITSLLLDIQENPVIFPSIITEIGKDVSDEVYVDHLPNALDLVPELCAQTDVSEDKYPSCPADENPKEEALTGIQETQQVSDLTGKTTPDTIEILTGTQTDHTVTDHLGNLYASEKEMCDHYGVQYSTFRLRQLNGWNLEQSLTEPPRHKPSKRKNSAKKNSHKKSKAGQKKKSAVKDHLGNAYPSIKAMCQTYGIGADTFRYRINHGRSLEEALTQPVSPLGTHISCQDH